MFNNDLMFFDASQIVENIKGNVEFLEKNRIFDLVNGIIDLTGIVPWYQRINNILPTSTDDEILEYKNLEELLVRVIISEKYINIEKIDETLKEVLNDVKNCDVVNIINLINSYIPCQATNYFLQNYKKDINYEWMIEMNIQNSDGDISQIYINNEDYFVNINFIIYPITDTILSIYLVYKHIIGKNILLRSQPLPIQKTIKLAIQQEERIRKLIEK
jgi:hypothetical protein